ncbi:hypothetical protein QJS83_10600 [Bdellovibrio sp. 22V]|uniref:hypothetical protein n=1 Tax=Bdellovibrio TaxID=958 RepID=UPI002543BFC4|nr:hypothetical protein [Bdellovibrio sp. 22V]WII70910.1 hypothetical protein QJS83_10600 [Bdellovibrio sp. 22V]
MKNTFLTKSLMGVLVLAALSLSACAKKDGSTARYAGRGTGVTQGGVQTPSSCGNANMDWGKIFDPYASPQFESQVKGFVSATLDPQSLGTISGNINDRTGIDFKGSFQFDSAGRLVTGSSSIHIKIVDSYVGQVYNGQTVAPYIVEFNAASEGMINRTTRQFQVKFKDSYGEIILQGAYNNQEASGTVYYQNYTAVNGYQASSGTLGSFRAYACALIK